MKTLNDLWNYICDCGRARACSQFYVSNPNETAKGFWNGMLTALEICDKVTKEDANNIWKEITS